MTMEHKHDYRDPNNFCTVWYGICTICGKEGKNDQEQRNLIDGVTARNVFWSAINKLDKAIKEK